MALSEIIFAFVIYLLLFGSKGVPSFARTLGEGVRKFRSATDEIQREILDTGNEIKTDFRNAKKKVEDDLGENL